MNCMEVSRTVGAARIACIVLVATGWFSCGAAAAPLPSRSDLLAIGEATRLAGAGQIDAATSAQARIRDPLGRSVAEWVILRSDSDAHRFPRYNRFLHDHRGWPGHALLERRAEARLWTERSDAATVLSFFAARPPRTALGKLAMARALNARGDSAAALPLARQAWRSEGFSAATEAEILHGFRDRLSRADHVARLHSRLYANDFGAALRAAGRLGPDAVALVAARTDVVRKSAKAAASLAAVPRSLRADPAYILTKVQWLRRSGRGSEAAQLMLGAPRDPAVIASPDLWWTERRALVRALLDDGKPALAYRLARDAAPAKENYRVDRAFTTGWIALRFLRDARTATLHFREIANIARGPTALARADYWLGRAAEASRDRATARQHFAAAARHGTTYYGQLACARLGCRKTTLRAPPALPPAQRAALAGHDLLRAVEILYASGNRRLVTPFVGDLGHSPDTALQVMIAESAARHRDPGALLAVGRAGVNRGLAFDRYAFPATGLPSFAPIGAAADKSLVYAITRTESAFHPRLTSGALATGYMQVTPAAAQTLARRMGFTFSSDRLHNDPAYNLQLGSAEIANLLSDYKDNHVLAFVGYNAGRGRVREWIARYGDPRRPEVDVVDWVERIPFAETRNYVQRVLENLQVYRARFGDPALAIDSDMRGRQG